MSNVHPNYIKSSNLILSIILIGCINFFLPGNSFSDGRSIATIIFIFTAIGILAYLVRQGLSWVKYLLLVLSIIGTIPSLILALSGNTIVGILNITQGILQIWAIVLLFKIPKSTNEAISNDVI